MVRDLIYGDKESLMVECHDLKEGRHHNLDGIDAITSKEYVVIHRNDHYCDSDQHSLPPNSIGILRKIPMGEQSFPSKDHSSLVEGT